MTDMNSNYLGKGKLIDLEIDSAGYKGLAVARVDGLVVFIRNGVPGDLVRARVISKKKNHVEAVVEEVIRESEHRVIPECRYFGVCGGCSWQNMNYSQQLIFKRQQVKEIFKHLGDLELEDIGPILPAPESYYYRNKMEFTFKANRWLTSEEIQSKERLSKDFALGLHVPKRWDKVLDLDVCYLQGHGSVEIVNSVRAVSLKQGWSAYDSRGHTGYLRNLVIRTGHYTGETMVDLVTSYSDPNRMEILTEVLQKISTGVTTVVNSINSSRSPVSSGDERAIYHGQGTIEEKIGSLTFAIGPDTFFQPNTVQAERLYEVVRDFAQLKGNETLYDLYSGIGTLSLFLANRVKKVVAIENQQIAIQDATYNAVVNGVDNCTFHCGDVRSELNDDFIRQHGKPDVLVVDPPRVGMHKDVSQALLSLAPERIIYVSCNPATQVRDLGILCQEYDIDLVQPVDMFPQTYHIENVVGLRRKSED